MSLIIKLSQELDWQATNKNGIQYLAVKKDSHAYPGRNIALYKEGEHSGIYAVGIIMGKALKPSLIPADEQHLIYNRSFLQLPVYLTIFTTESYLSKKYVNHLPSLHYERTHWSIRYDRLVMTYGVMEDLDFLNVGRHVLNTTEGYYKYHFHLLREKKFRDNRTWIKNEVLMNQKTCAKCGIKGPERKQYEPYFFEFHETTPVDFTGDYQEINPDNFEVLCGNCHKLAHSEVYFESFPEKKETNHDMEWSGWFSDFDNESGTNE